MKQLNLFSVIFALVCIYSTSLFAITRDGQDSSGGGFRYVNTSTKYLNNNAEFLYKHLSGIPNEVFQKIVSKYSDKKIDQIEFRKIILNVEFAPEKRMERMNQHGYLEELAFNYSIENRKITALAPFFEDYNKFDLSNRESMSIARQLIHEATHIFGIGTLDDKISYDLSTELLYESYTSRCGINGNIKNRIKACNSIKNNFPLITNNFLEINNPKNSAHLYHHYKIFDTFITNNFYTAIISTSVKAKQAKDICKQMGDSWRLPSADEAKEIFNFKLFTYQITYNGKYTRVIINTDSDRAKYIGKKLKVKKAYGFFNSSYDVACISDDPAVFN